MNPTIRFSIILVIFALLIALSYEPSTVNPQAAEHHLVKLDKQGKPLPVWAGPWACVKDTKNRLIWEVKNNDENLHHKSWSYSWYDGATGIADKGNCNHETDYFCDAQDLLEKTREEARCGISNWRLPTAEELNTLVRLEHAGYGPVIDYAMFPHTRKSYYWTSENEQALTGFYAQHGKGAIAIDFKNGQQKPLPYSNASFVRLVSSY